MVLRVRFDNGFQAFTEIGEEFNLITKEGCVEEFNRCASVQFGENDQHFTPETYAFISYGNGSKTRPLYHGQDNHLLNDSGGVFKDLTNKLVSLNLK